MALQERIPVTTPEQIAQTAALAAAIWTEHYAGLLPEGQPAYMVEKFQSAAAIARADPGGRLSVFSADRR